MRWHCMCRVMLSACKRMSLVHREVNQLGPFIARDPYAGYSKVRGRYGINYYYSHGEISIFDRFADSARCSAVTVYPGNLQDID